MKHFRLFLLLVLWDIAVVVLPVGIFWGVITLLRPELGTGTVWGILFIGLPVFFTIVLCPAFALLGVWLAGRLPPPASSALAEQDPAKRAHPRRQVERWVGAGIGAMLGAALPLAFAAWIFQNSGGSAIFLFCSIYIFVAFAGFVAFLNRARRTPSDGF